MISFDVSREDFAAICTIIDRARKMQPAAMKQSKMDWHMDIAACHVNGCPLKLAELAIAADADFVHDVFGIRNHIDRATGKLGNCFFPRYAKIEE